MKRILLMVFVLGMLVCSRCGKDDETDNFKLLTTPVWTSDSLLVNGTGAGEPGQFLYKFKGDARFNKDGTGTFGKYNGKWWFSASQTQIVISSDSLALPLTTKIAELTQNSLKITTAVPDINNANAELKIRMTFKSK